MGKPAAQTLICVVHCDHNKARRVCLKESLANFPVGKEKIWCSIVSKEYMASRRETRIDGHPGLRWFTMTRMSRSKALENDKVRDGHFRASWPLREYCGALWRTRAANLRILMATSMRCDWSLVDDGLTVLQKKTPRFYRYRVWWAQKHWVYYIEPGSTSFSSMPHLEKQKNIESGIWGVIQT